jgi:hypothetical protein
MSHCCPAYSICKEVIYIEDKAEIPKYGLLYTVTTKLLKMGDYISELYHILMDNYFTAVPLATALYKMEIL